MTKAPHGSIPAFLIKELFLVLFIGLNSIFHRRFSALVKFGDMTIEERCPITDGRHERPRIACGDVQSLEEDGGYEVIAVYEGEPIPFGGGQSDVAGVGLASVILMDYGGQSIRLDKRIAELARAIRRPIIHQNHLVMRISLVDDTLKTFT